jgi:hypothetical protein
MELFNDYYEEHSMFLLNPISKPFIGHVEESSFELCYVNKNQKNSFAPIYYGRKDEKGNVIIRKRPYFSTAIFMAFIFLFLATGIIMGTLSFIRDLSFKTALGSLGGFSILIVLFIIVRVGYNINDKAAKGYFDRIFFGVLLESDVL